MGEIEQTGSADHVQENDLEALLNRVVALLREFRDTFLRWVVVEAEGRIPGLCLTIEVARLNGLRGLLQIVSHGNKCSCTFESREGERTSWTIPEVWGLDEYERLLFSIWTYDSGILLTGGSTGFATWYIDDHSTADRLEDIAEKIDELLIHLKGRYPWMAGGIRWTIRYGAPKWRPGRVSWSYIKKLDEEIKGCELKGKELRLEVRPAIESDKQSLHQINAGQQVKKWNPPKGFIGSKTIVNDYKVPRTTLQGWAERDQAKVKKDPVTSENYYPQKWLENRLATYRQREKS